MVVQRSQGMQKIEEHSAVTKSFFKRAFVSSMTIYPLKFSEIPSGYTNPILYATLLASVNATIALVLPLVNEKGLRNMTKALARYFSGASTWLLYFLLASFLSSYIGAKIADIEHDSKQFGLVVSSLTYLSILNLLSMIQIDILSYIAKLAGSLLMSYYVRESYQESTTYQSTRTNTIHGIWIFVYCISFPYINDAAFSVSNYMTS